MEPKGKRVLLPHWSRSVVRFLSRTPTRKFVVYPILTVGWEILIRRGRLELHPGYVVLMVVGYFIYKLSTRYRVKQGGGGPGEKWETQPQRLITTGPYAFTRNPVYVGHLIFLLGLTLTLNSLFAAILMFVIAVTFHKRVLNDEIRLAELFGQEYFEYTSRVKRWIPAVY
jgi:protein-S-isoprenylcysteine O-methyltransferase Ste14